MTLAPAGLEPVDILIVDDRPANILSLKGILERPEYNLVSASSGPEALAKVLRHDFAVILLDVAMPGMDGFEAASIIKQREKSRLVPIIFVTASVYEMEHVFRGYTIGAVDYLRKPVDTHAVRTKVAVFVELFRQRKQIERQAAQLREAEIREQTLLRERAEGALRESEALYQVTFEEAPVGIGQAGPDGRWVKVNRQLCALLGLARDRVAGRPLQAMVADGEAALAAALERVRTGALAVYKAEHRLATKRARAVWATLTVAPLLGPDGGLLRFIAVVEDVTDRKEVELERARLVQELQAGIQARDDFLSIAAHELKTPITPLRLQASSLLRELERQRQDGAGNDLERLQRRLRKIDGSAARLDELVDRLLDVTRMSIGRLELQRAECDLSSVAKDVLARLGAEDQAGVAISLDAPAPVVGHWDRVRLEQVLMNLLQNALRYGAGRPVDVAVAAADGLARLSVRDRGIGIAPEEQGRIFERFERLSPVKNYGGFGLGLWIVRHIVEAHGGRVLVDSAVGEGSTFTVELPVGADARRAPPLADAAQAEGVLA